MAASPAMPIHTGIAASPGLALGPLVPVVAPAAARRAAGTPDEEAGALRGALAAAGEQIAALAEAAGGDGAAILEFQSALLEDEALLDPVFAAIADGFAADAAWRAGMAEQIALYREAPDEYLQARAADLIDLRDRVLGTLEGASDAPQRIPLGAVVFAEDLPPSRFLAIDWSAGGGLALAQGSPSSHVAMLARARGVPMVVQLGPVPDTAATALLDAEQGTLELDPPAARIAEVTARGAEGARSRAAASAALAGAPVVWDGEAVRLLINIHGLADLAHPDARHAEGIGLMRTEFLFDDPAGLPDEAAQFAVYREVLRWAGERPVTIRTVDAGGDKPIRGFTEDGEANPFLGVRGLRLCLQRPEVFAVQLRALARAAPHGNLKVMFPMVTVPDEFAAAVALFRGAVDALQAAGVPAALPPLGIMVEVPAAALTIARFPAAFLSIGSNDLTQYVTACDRGNGALATLNDPLNPGVLELIGRVVAHGRRQGIGVSLCGDMAGDPRCSASLLACGLREFSMGPPSLARIKQALLRLQQDAGGE